MGSIPYPLPWVNIGCLENIEKSIAFALNTKERGTRGALGVHVSVDSVVERIVSKMPCECVGS